MEERVGFWDGAGVIFTLPAPKRRWWQFFRAISLQSGHMTEDGIFHFHLTHIWQREWWEIMLGGKKNPATGKPFL